MNVLERIQDNNGTIIKEYSLTSSKNGTEYARETQPPVPDLFYSLKIFDENGKIKNFTDQVFWGIFEFEFGKHYFYNKDGSLEKTVDFTKQFDDYKVKVDDLLNILTMENIRFENFDDETKQRLSSTWFENNKDITPEMIFNSVKKSFETNEESYGRFEQKILNPYNRTDVQRIHIDFNYQKKTWIVKKDFSSLGVVYLEIDANSKRIIKTNYELY
ncbi:hypothetical protein [Chryseobacterium taklimakanense]|uniref:hypothetical protein n=1 Tax=Chryseobacterium taklimakanense TaxID=536441 RepID=UPI0023F9CD2D|nr:hypothetical protein [Chryseobacterium taklimakanense]